MPAGTPEIPNGIGPKGGIFYADDVSFANPITGLGGITKYGDNLTLAAVNTYGGPTNVINGSLTLGVNDALPDTTAVNLGSGTLTVGGDNTPTTYFGIISGDGSLILIGDSTLVLSGNNTYTGGTTVSGMLLVEGSLSTGPVNVSSGGILGGDGTIGGSLHFASGANLAFDASETLTINGTSVSFDGFGVANLAGLDSSAALGTYTLLNGAATFDFTNVANFGADHAYALGGGKSAYFQEGSLQLIVVPEPSTSVLFLVGAVAGIFLKRKRHHGNAPRPSH